MSASDVSLTTAAGMQNLGQARSSQAIDTLKSQSQLKSRDTQKIDKAAKDFESILLGEWLEKAEKSFASVPGTDPDQSKDSGYDQYQSISCQFLAEGLSRGGGIGIASMISRHLKAIEAQKNGETAKLPDSGPISGIAVKVSDR